MQARFKMVDTNVLNAQGQPTGSAQQAWQGSIHRTIIAHLEERAAPAPSANADDAPFAWPYSHNPDRTCHEEEVSTPRTPLSLVR